MRIWILGLLLATTLSCHAEDANTPAPAVISVSGQGAVTAAPDMASVSVGVTTQARDAAEAMAANNRAMTALFGVLDDFGIAKPDLQSSGFNVYPRYDRPADNRNTTEITSYVVTNQLTVRQRDLDRLGELLSAVVASGSNQLGSLSFGNTDEAKLLDKARTQAVANARHKASLYAEAAGGRLGPVVSISEGGTSQPAPMMRAGMAMQMEAVPIAAGENEYRAVVNMVFEFEEDTRSNCK
jgi:uncharacterized protein YggE